MAEGIPITRRPASPEQVERIRAAVRGAGQLGDSRLARPEDAPGLYALFSEPKVNAPIYSLPRPLTVENVRAFIEDHIAQRERGEGLLFVRDPGDGQIMGYSDIQVWRNGRLARSQAGCTRRCIQGAPARRARLRLSHGCSRRCISIFCVRRPACRT